MKLGTQVKDKLTPFTGTVVAKAQYLYGCQWVQVQSNEVKDGRPVAAVWMDEQRVELAEEEMDEGAGLYNYRANKGGPGDEPGTPSFPNVR